MPSMPSTTLRAGDVRAEDAGAAGGLLAAGALFAGIFLAETFLAGAAFLAGTFLAGAAFFAGTFADAAFGTGAAFTGAFLTAAFLAGAAVAAATSGGGDAALTSGAAEGVLALATARRRGAERRGGFGAFSGGAGWLAMFVPLRRRPTAIEHGHARRRQRTRGGDSLARHKTVERYRGRRRVLRGPT